jgi:hypothetical protein
MGSVFKEQIVKRKPTFKDSIIRVLLVVAVTLIFFITLVTPLGGFAFIITVAAGFGAYLLMSFLNVEYEYAFTDGELDIDVIYNRSRRKRVFTGMVKEFEIMAHVEDKNRMGDFNNAQETRDYSSGVVTENTYAFLTMNKGKRTKVIIEPNEVMLKAFSTVLTPRKLIKKV